MNCGGGYVACVMLCAGITGGEPRVVRHINASADTTIQGVETISETPELDDPETMGWDNEWYGNRHLSRLVSLFS